MPRIPISDLKAIAKKHNLRQAILFAWDGATQFVVTYGQSVVDCDQAAQGGENLRVALKWPEIHAEPARVTKLKTALAALKEAAKGFLAARKAVDEPGVLAEELKKIIEDDRKPGPICRDCADHADAGVCPYSKLPCDPAERLAVRLVQHLITRNQKPSVSEKLLRNLLK
jgi:hypothetical protein